MKKILLASSFILIFTFIALAQNKSVYTSTDTKKCKTIEQSDKEAGWYRGHCPGVGGYKLELTEGDLRQSITIIAPNKKKFELNFGSVSGGFSAVGAKAEWRVKGTVPTALIIRFNASENPEDSTKITSYLIVSKITKTSACMTDVVKPSTTQNAEAQKLADAAIGKPCKKTEID